MRDSDPRASRSRNALLSAATDVLIRNPDASLSEIAAQAGVGRATLYRHFQTREHLLVELALESLAETDKACAHIQEENLKGRRAIEEIFRSVMPLANRFHFLLSLWPSIETHQKLKDAYTDQLYQLVGSIEEAKMENSIDKSLPNDWLIELIDNLLYTGWHCIANGSLTVERATELSIRAFFDGVGKSR